MPYFKEKELYEGTCIFTFRESQLGFCLEGFWQLLYPWWTHKQACGSFAHPGEKNAGEADTRDLKMLKAKSKIRMNLGTVSAMWNMCWLQMCISIL